MIKIVALSDTHGQLNKIIDEIPDGDILIHAGDALNWGEEEELEEFVKLLGSLPHKHKIYVPGNHDICVESDPSSARRRCEEHGISLLINEQIQIEGIKVYGSPVTPIWGYWSFMQSPATICYTWDNIPLDTDILITHGPPRGILDEVPKFDKGDYIMKECGCPALRLRLDKVKPDLHFFGHVHYSHGEKNEDGVSYYNVAICDKLYHPDQEVTVVDYDPCAIDSPLSQDPDRE